MKPMNWLILFILTNMMLIFMNTMIFFMKNYNLMKFEKKKKNYLNWKW